MFLIIFRFSRDRVWGENECARERLALGSGAHGSFSTRLAIPRDGEDGGGDEMRGGNGPDYMEGNHGSDWMLGEAAEDDMIGGNSAGDGGGVYIEFNDAVLGNVTLRDNTSGFGGGLVVVLF